MQFFEWLARARPERNKDSALERVLAWIRAIALADDAFLLDGPREQGVFAFPFPSDPNARPTRLGEDRQDNRIRFMVRAGKDARRRGERDAAARGWRAIVRLDDLFVTEQDTPHGSHRPLRLGLSSEEAETLLGVVRGAATRFARGEDEPLDKAAGKAAGEEPPRLLQRSAIAVAIWTRGRLRGSVVTPPGRALWAARQGAIWASRDPRFEPLTATDLGETVFQVGLVHSPSIPLSRRTIETRDAYADKALSVADGPRFGMYLPEAFNLGAPRRLSAVAESVAREKARLSGLVPGAAVEVSEVTEVIESADHSRAVSLDGPAPCTVPGSDAKTAHEMALAACTWLTSIQTDDGAWPQRIQVRTGEAVGNDPVRLALTAWGLAAFGVAARHEPAVACARHALAWFDRSGAARSLPPPLALAAGCYRGRAADALGNDAELQAAATGVLARLDPAPSDPLVLAHAASFLELVGARHRRAAPTSVRLADELHARFVRATTGPKPPQLAEWAELAAFDLGSPRSSAVIEWLLGPQLSNGAFPATPASSYAYTRGTAKIVEVLALHPTHAPALYRALGWLRAMQYCPDSAFFVPVEHRARVLGGFRHDVYDTDAWIDAAGHLLVAVARLEQSAREER